MKKGFLWVVFSSLVILSSHLSAKFLEYKTKIISIDGNRATIKASKEIRVGSSGIVLHSFGKNHSTVVAKAILIAPDTILFKRYDDLKQSVLPVPKVLPKVGDIVILNYLYNHALAIAPNYETYKNIISKHQDISWFHPDLFAAKLYADSNPSPNKEDFQKMCKDYSFALLYFAINDRGYFVDCNSFKALDAELLDGSQNKKMVPFYSRIKDIKNSWFSFGKSKIQNYDQYYLNLLRQR